MSEPPSWTAPGAGDPDRPERHPAPGPGTPAGQGPPAGGWGQPAAVPGGSWAAPAPRPGIVPLRPLTLGELWDGAFRAVRTNPKPLLGFSAVVVVVITAASLAVNAALQGRLLSFEQDPSASPEQVLSTLGGDAPGLVGGYLVSAVLTLVATAVLTGVVTVSVSTAVLGRRTPGAELWRRVRERLWALVGVSVVISLIPGAALLVLLLPGFLLTVGGAVGGSGGSVAGGVVLLLVGLLLGLVASFWLTARLLLAPAALILEGQGVGGAVKRAWGLSRRGFWRLLGVWLLTTVCILVVSGVVTAPFSIIATVVGTVVGVDSPLYLPVTLGITGIGTALVSTVVYPLQSAVTALLYVDQRMRQEGLDVELARSAAQ
ncbi:glycerophosphoryl diester phosphodiesterase membrane domain-containing protein [Quadrisphaera sp. RL12-1S]|uniref:glycerophosphoryl diester phosphodiesterase membrane domain-containing protein n=1 Tax=Quadrisphaera sp. RL12-1S TaxID=2763011 RepID=UPI0016445F50|nr:glycerophosphoryl diester phosphodiesterase membrane domain-containing protein [Quadrisphaera sp. RL12-1S]MBC3762844.1 glycerophosphoryl diester phosphodiesterase membrane domain-containing protein [Quadrisphaera sp. RL12-1S]